MTKYEPHELANLFPMMNAEEMTALITDMRENGFDASSPIITYKGKILDGRNRYAAAQVAKVEPIFFEYEGSDLLSFVLSKNLHRRHLNETQRAGVASKLANMERGATDGNKYASKNYSANLQNSLGRRKAYRDEEDANAWETKVSIEEAAELLNVSPRTVATFRAVEKSAPELVEKMQSGEMTASKAAKTIKTGQAHETYTEQTNAKQGIKPQVEIADASEWLFQRKQCDLLLTDPPYSTDVDNISEFAAWVRIGLDAVKPTGRAYIFIGAYPKEVKAYLSQETPEHIKLEQILVWTYKNTLGNNPKDRYKLNYQFCLYYKGIDAPELNCPITNEQWAVIEMNAPDGRLGDRYHAWQKPLELGEMIVRHATKEGDTVYDPFTCTGTFLLAAGGLGRISYGCDISEENLTIAIERGCRHA